MGAQRSLGRPLWRHGNTLGAAALLNDLGCVWDHFFWTHFGSLGEALGAFGSTKGHWQASPDQRHVSGVFVVRGGTKQMSHFWRRDP